MMGWSVVYASAPLLLETNPGSSTQIAANRPNIRVRWAVLPGAKIKRAKLTLDGREYKMKVSRNGRSASLRPTEALAEGRHKARVKMAIGMGAARKVSSSWSFTVDTVPPPLKTADGLKYHVTAEPTSELTITTEPDAILKASLNGRSIKAGEIGEDGHLKISVKRLKKKNRLRISARDAVGNIRTISLPIILDRNSPIIENLRPKDGGMVQLTNPEVKVDLKDKGSGVESATLKIDGKEVLTKRDDGTNKLAYVGDELNDGSHTATVEAVDYVGHKSIKSWNFKVDTRRIVVNRGARRLYLYKDGQIQKVYGVAVGMPGHSTPGGRWEVISKQYMPTWTNPGSAWAASMPRSIGPGWGNPLGIRALGLSAGHILIHGTSNYGSIGRAASHGCIRLRNSDIVDLYQRVDVGVPVDII